VEGEDLGKAPFPRRSLFLKAETGLMGTKIERLHIEFPNEVDIIIGCISDEPVMDYWRKS
jgi:hypothetical protein